MTLRDASRYLLNCFLLVLPVFLWNILFTGSLPRGYSMEMFWKDIPPALGIAENVLRVVVFLTPLLFPLSVVSPLQRAGLALYGSGMVLYFLSWIMQMVFPESAWSTSVWGFLAPAYTTIFWLVGIGLIGRKTFFDIPYHPLAYIGAAVAFVLVHTSHAWIVFRRF